MARGRSEPVIPGRAFNNLARLPRRHPYWGLLLLAVLAAVLLVLFLAQRSPPPPVAGPGEYLFCFWNVENLFDDRNDHRTGPGDADLDPWFANDPAALHEKLDHLSTVLVELNAGRGPDILAAVEVESVRAAELLRDALNAKLADPELHYKHLLMKEVSAGRHIAPAILTRLPVKADRTQLLDTRRRILEGHIVAGGHDLVVVASHWTSRRTDPVKDGSSRARYADLIYGRFQAMYRTNPDVAFLVCGDFNDDPKDRSVIRNLRAIGDREAVLGATGEPLLYNVTAGLDPRRQGTLYYDERRSWHVFDQIAVSPGMLRGGGWSYVPGSVAVVKTPTRWGDKVGEPWKFARRDDRGRRGYSDHFAVTVLLKVE
jgi:endonuclease/exonuclease/phosphatase family metal-dependent hydrolase